MVVDEKKVVVRRSGTVHSEMSFELGVPDAFTHRSAFGCVFFEIHTKELDVSVSGEELSVRITYELFSGTTVISTNHIYIVAK